ncbi:MAG: hypothetical protein KDB87_09535 [Flavobacteriales bacterium]|nr:hypothetical protein [Flavobacteriales bacterium]MCB0813388.1 hypothetical protein [Flavobacteriales bacterium]
MGVPPGIAALGSELVEVFNTRYPDAAVVLVEAPDRELARRFEEGTLDLVLLRASAEGLLPEGADRTVNTLAWSALAILPTDTVQQQGEGMNVRTTDSALVHLWRTLDGLHWSAGSGDPSYEARDLAGGTDRNMLGLPITDSLRVRPSASSIADRSYPAVHRIVVLHRPREKDALHAFHTWLMGEDGQRVVLRAGLVPGILPERRIEVVPGSPE